MEDKYPTESILLWGFKDNVVGQYQALSISDDLFLRSNKDTSTGEQGIFARGKILEKFKETTSYWPDMNESWPHRAIIELTRTSPQTLANLKGIPDEQVSRWKDFIRNGRTKDFFDEVRSLKLLTGTAEGNYRPLPGSILPINETVANSINQEMDQKTFSSPMTPTDTSSTTIQSPLLPFALEQVSDSISTLKEQI